MARLSAQPESGQDRGAVGYTGAVIADRVRHFLPSIAWKKQLLDGAAGVFEGGGTASEDTASVAQVDLLYRQIGQLEVENDFLSRKLGK
jgi:hypothetical protein